MTDCHHCHNETAQAQKWETLEEVRIKASGWIGSNWTDPERRKAKPKTIYLCGICYGLREVENMRERGENVNELQTALLELAEKERTAPVKETVRKSKARKPRQAKRTTRRPKMTAEDATYFETFSVQNVATVQNALDCGCEPYIDVFTYNRWRAQGFQVQRGQKAVKLPVVKTVDRENDEGETETRRIRGTSAVFCRHQVAEREEVAA